MDFIEQLPDSEGFTAILVVVDHFTKQALFIPTHDTITSAQLPRYHTFVHRRQVRTQSHHNIVKYKYDKQG
jgi:hypothetical protein